MFGFPAFRLVQTVPSAQQQNTMSTSKNLLEKNKKQIKKKINQNQNQNQNQKTEMKFYSLPKQESGVFFTTAHNVRV